MIERLGSSRQSLIRSIGVQAPASRPLSRKASPRAAQATVRGVRSGPWVPIKSVRLCPSSWTPTSHLPSALRQLVCDDRTAVDVERRCLLILCSLKPIKPSMFASAVFLDRGWSFKACVRAGRCVACRSGSTCATAGWAESKSTSTILECIPGSGQHASTPRLCPNH